MMGYLFHEAVTPYDRSLWVYHHRADLDDARYRDMLARDAQLEARVRDLERQGVQRDPGYVVPSMKDNPDLQYSKDYVDSCYNAEDVPHHSDGGITWHGVGQFFLWLFIIIFVLGVLWAIFVKDWR
jgi:hypothetical protein